jgi:phospholipid/cholesterol/gamma-HCH transport system substrate-binding protein
VSAASSPLRARVVALALVLAGGLSLPGLLGVSYAIDPFRPSSTTITAEFPRAVGLYARSRVYVDGLQAGWVEEVTPGREVVRVRMAVRDVALAPDATATLRLRSLIGERYVELGPVWSGKGPRLADGAVIPPARTIVPAEISEVLDEATRVAEEVDGPATGRLMAELAQALAGRQDAVGGTIEGLADVGRVLSARSSELDASLGQLQRTVGALAERDDQVVSIVQSSTVLADALLAQDGALDGAVSGLDRLLGQVADVVGGQKEHLVAAADDLGRIGLLLADHEAGWQSIIDTLPYAAYGFSRAITNDGERWFLMPQVTGVLLQPWMPNVNSRGGPGSEEGDGRVVPEIDSTDSPVADAVPDTVDFTGPTGPGPLLPAGTIGTPLGDVRVSDDAGDGP